MVINMEELNYEEYIGRRVIITGSTKSSYRKLKGKCGVVDRTSSGDIGVLIDGERNQGSSYGVYWFKRNELKVLDKCEEENREESREDSMLNGFKHVAIVNLLEDYNKKDYAFALYDTNLEEGIYENDLLVVNAKNEDNRMLATIKKIVPVESYDGVVTKEVVGVVHMDAYYYRKSEEKRLAELNKRKTALKKKIDAEIKKKRDIEFYKQIAETYPELNEMVKELEALGE